jgi:hypothetical protein
MMYGLRFVSNEHPEGIGAINTMADLLLLCDGEEVTALDAARMVTGLRSMTSTSPEVIRLVDRITALVLRCKGDCTFELAAMMLQGMQGLSSDVASVRDLITAVRPLIETSVGPSVIAQEASMLLQGLRCMTSDVPQVVKLVAVLNSVLQACYDRLSSQQLSKFFGGTYSMYK